MTGQRTHFSSLISTVNFTIPVYHLHIFIKKHGKDQVKDVGLNVEEGEENAYTVEKTAFAVENIQIQGLKN